MKVYLYLLRRDKKGLRILATLPSDKEILPTRIADIRSMNLPKKFESKILSITEKNKMLWEPWVESSTSYKDLKTSLIKRGCGGLPITAMPEFLIESAVKINSVEKPKVMLRKFSCNKPALSKKSH